jgi:hypothetical protein
MTAEVHLVITPVVSQIRIYHVPNGYEERIPYEGIITVTHITDKMAYLSGAHGIIDRSIYRKIIELLKEQGIDEVFYERRGTFITKKNV